MFQPYQTILGRQFIPAQQQRAQSAGQARRIVRMVRMVRMVIPDGAEGAVIAEALFGSG